MDMGEATEDEGGAMMPPRQKHLVATPAQLARIAALAEQLDMPLPLVQREAADRWGVPILERLTWGRAKALIGWLDEMVRASR